MSDDLGLYIVIQAIFIVLTLIVGSIISMEVMFGWVSFLIVNAIFFLNLGPGFRLAS